MAPPRQTVNRCVFYLIISALPSLFSSVAYGKGPAITRGDCINKKSIAAGVDQCKYTSECRKGNRYHSCRQQTLYKVCSDGKNYMNLPRVCDEDETPGVNDEDGGRSDVESPTFYPSASPTEVPVADPTEVPVADPTETPTELPSAIPTSPTASSTSPRPSLRPTSSPTRSPSEKICSVDAKIKCTAGTTPCEEYVPSMQCNARPHYMTFRFVNGVCNGENRQGGDVQCKSAFGGTMGRKRVRLSILGYNRNFLYFTKEVEVGDLITIRGFPGGKEPLQEKLKVFITADASDNYLQLQYVIFNTACATPEKSFKIGDRFGSLVIEGFTNPEQGSVPNLELKYTYQIQNNGSPIEVDNVTTTRHGNSEDLKARYFYKYGTNEVESDNMLSVFRKEKVDLTKPGSYTTSFNVDAKDTSGMTCSAGSSFTMNVAGR